MSNELVRMIGIGFGVIMFGWGWWTLNFTRKPVSKRRGILSVISIIAGAILAFWSA